MTESYHVEPKKNSFHFKEILLILLGSAIPLLFTAINGWYTGRAEIASIQSSVENMETTMTTSMAGLSSDSKEMSKRLSDIEHVVKQFVNIDERVKTLELEKRTLQEKVAGLEARTKSLEDRMHFYHETGPDKDRRTLDEWKEELEKRQRQRQGKRGTFDDSWDGSFNSFRGQGY